MKIKPVYFFGLIAIAIILGTFFSVIKLTPDPLIFNAGDIISFRKTKNTLLANQVGAPFYKDLDFDSLTYFGPNEKEIYKSDVFKIADGEELDLFPDRIGYASHRVVSYLILERETWRDTLFVLKDLEEKSDSVFFVPFTDPSNGSETYGGGRYLDLILYPGKQASINFNFAYNPYCVYKAEFVCPKSPSMNHLSRKIEAGEKNYSK